MLSGEIAHKNNHYYYYINAYIQYVHTINYTKENEYCKEDEKKLTKYFTCGAYWSCG